MHREQTDLGVCAEYKDIGRKQFSFAWQNSWEVSEVTQLRDIEWTLLRMRHCHTVLESVSRASFIPAQLVHVQISWLQRQYWSACKGIWFCKSCLGFPITSNARHSSGMARLFWKAKQIWRVLALAIFCSIKNSPGSLGSSLSPSSSSLKVYKMTSKHRLLYSVSTISLS